MPTYEYRCKDCGAELEVVQSFTDDALTVCPTCKGALRKVFGSVGISFKGSGFYKNDSRGSAGSSGGSGDGGSSSSESGSSGSGSSSDGGSSSSDTSSSGSSDTKKKDGGKKKDSGTKASSPA